MCDGQTTVTGASGSAARPSAIARSIASRSGRKSIRPGYRWPETTLGSGRTGDRPPRHRRVLRGRGDAPAARAAGAADGGGRRPERAGGGGDRQLRGPGVRHPLRHELRGGAAAVSARGVRAARHRPLPRVVRPGVGARARAVHARWRCSGMDEGYLELPDEGAGEAADAIRRAVAERIRLSCSLGVATCKVVAKVASDRDKPGGVTVVPPGEEAAFLAPLPLRTLPGWARAPRSASRAAGLATVGDLAALDDERLRELSVRASTARTSGAGRAASTRGASSRSRRSASRSPPRRTFAVDVRDVGELERDRPRPGGRGRRRAAAPRPGGPDGHDQAALRRLPDHHPRPDRPRRHRRRGRHLDHRPRAAAPCPRRAGGRPAADGRRRVGAERGAAAHPVRAHGVGSRP